MATTKTRINISVSSEVEKMLKGIARRDRVPTATKAAQLLQVALEIEEDYVLGMIAHKRNKPGMKLLTHKQIWG